MHDVWIGSNRSVPKHTQLRKYSRGEQNAATCFKQRVKHTRPASQVEVHRLGLTTQSLLEPVGSLTKVEQAASRLEPGLAKIEADYQARMDALMSELASATEDQREAVQQQAAELKVQWTLALANRQLELARQRGDVAAETEILHAIQAMQKPPATEGQPVVRDPNAGIQIEGGAR